MTPSSNTNGHSRVCELCSDLVQMESDQAIVNAIVGMPEALGFYDSRYYDANRCPFMKCHFYILRTASRTYEKAGIGYRIYDPTLTDEAAASRNPVWGDADSTKRKERETDWICDLELTGHEWIDVPIFAGGQVLGLWALNRPKKKGSERKNTSALLKRLACVAGLKIHELRQERISALSGETLAYALKLSHSTQRDFGRQETAILKFCLDKTCRALNAATLAYFQFDPFANELQKMAEIQFDGKNIHDISDRKADRSYRRGQCLTGVAWDNPTFRHIPDFAELQRRQPELVDRGSLELHERLLGQQEIRTVVYERVYVPGALPGFLRGINRADDPRLTFTGEHCELLHRIAESFAQVLGTIHASARLITVGNAFTDTVKALQREDFSYDALGLASKALGFPMAFVSIWAVDQTLAEVWSNDPDIEKSMKSQIGIQIENPLSKYNLDGYVMVSKIPDPIRSILANRGVELVYSIFLPPPDPNREDSETALVFFPLVVSGGTESIADARQFWQSQSSLLTAATLLGQLAGMMRELARNRTMLFSAEQAVGIIGHEMRSPLARLSQIAEQLSEQELRLLESVDRDGKLRTVTSITHYGKPRMTTLEGRAQISSWLAERRERISDYTEIGQRVVADAIWWARMGGKKVEMDLKPIRLAKIIDICVDELADEIQLRAPLHVDIKVGVRRVPPFVADPVLMHTLFFNLLDNAVKYSHSRGKFYFGVTVTAEHQANLVDVRITNWGLGIDRSDYTNIFSSFFRSSHRDRLHTVRGVGLGLATCRRIVRLHGGKIWVISKPTLNDPTRTAAMEGFETTFSVRLPTTLKPGRIDVATDRYKID